MNEVQKDALDILTKTETWLGYSPSRWTKGTFGKTADGHEIGPFEGNCASTCLVGALKRASGRNASWARADIVLALDTVEGVLGVSSIVSFNDAYETTYDDVMHVIAEAKAVLEETAKAVLEETT